MNKMDVRGTLPFNYLKNGLRAFESFMLILLLLIPQAFYADNSYNGKSINLSFNPLNDNFESEIVQQQQQKRISGVVTDEDGLPVIGANIIERETNQGTITDANGSFSLNVSTNARIRISYIGYLEQEINTVGKTSFNIVLREDSKSLDEVVVVGYGTQRKVNLTGAIDQVTVKDIESRPTSNIVSSLQGKMPGLNIKPSSGDPRQSPEINIRGFNSINGGKPLVLVDGIEDDISLVNPNDIESVTVLKDAASSAIYGARGSFGVVLITTKTGKAGKIEMTYSNNFNFSTPTTRTDYISNAYDYGKVVDAAMYGYNGSTITGYNDLDWEILKMVSDGDLEPFHLAQPDGTYKFYYNTNWYDILLRKWQNSQIHNVSISGGTDKVRAYLSGRIYERQTIHNLQDVNMNVYNFKSNIVFNPTKWLELSNTIKFSNKNDIDFGGSNTGYGGLFSDGALYRQNYPFYPFMVDGMPTDVGLEGAGGTGGVAGIYDGNNWQKSNTDDLTNTFRVRITPVEGLEINMDYSYNSVNTNRTDRLNQFQYLSTNKLTLVTEGVNRLTEYRWKDVYKAQNIFATYTKVFNRAHNFKLMLGYNQESFERDRISATVDNLLISDKANLVFGTEMNNMTGSTQSWAIQGYFGRLNYDYDKKYLVEINSRYDGSSRFPADSRWGLFPSISFGWQMDREDFWSVLENDVVSSVKLRASYGRLGNQSVSLNTFRQLMGLGKSSWLVDGQQVVYARTPAPLPAHIGWEKVNSIDFGTDVGFFDNKLMASFDWYEKETTDMYLPGEPLPAVFGASEPKRNYASLHNRGFELSLRYNTSFNLLGSPFDLSVSGNVSNFIGTITKFDNPEGLMSTYWEGQELGQIWGYHVDGQFQSDDEAREYQYSFNNPNTDLNEVYNYILNRLTNSDWKRLRGGDVKYVDVNNDGKINKGNYTLDDHGDLMPIGNTMPRFPFGFNFNANWKGFNLSVDGQGIGRQDWYPEGDLYWGTYQRPYLSLIRKDLVENAWTPDNTDGIYPQIYRGYAALLSNRSLYEINDYYLTNIGYLRIKNMTLGYEIPQSITKYLNIKSIRVYVSGENILTWSFGGLTRYIDPEQAASTVSYSNPGDASARAERGFPRGYPMNKTYSFGVNIKL